MSDAPVKKGRGRPPKAKSAAVEPKKEDVKKSDENGATKEGKRGRPAKTGTATKVEKRQAAAPTGKGRGRPPKVAKKPEPEEEEEEEDEDDEVVEDSDKD